ncbi:MAG: ABC transporter permease [Clostridiales bacterium]|nr:ABC transporter permease [Clostridiales bacterium]
MKKLRSTISKLYSVSFLAAILIVWQLICSLGLVPSYMLPSPADVGRALAENFGTLMGHARTTLAEAFAGLFLAIVLAAVIAVAMDRFAFLYRAAYPVMVVTQTIPTVAIAPLLVSGMGYGPEPQSARVVIACVVPIAVALRDGLKQADADTITLMRAMGASRRQIFWHVKLPASVSGLFSGLKIAVSYSIVAAVVAEWLGGTNGLGVYMTRVRKTYAFDKMFAVIFVIVCISLLLLFLVRVLERALTPWNYIEHKNEPPRTSGRGRKDGSK